MAPDNLSVVLELHVALQKLIGELLSIVELQNKELQRIEKEMHYMWKEMNLSEFEAKGEPQKNKRTHQN